MKALDGIGIPKGPIGDGDLTGIGQRWTYQIPEAGPFLTLGPERYEQRLKDVTVQSDQDSGLWNGDENAFVCDLSVSAPSKEGEDLHIVGPEEKQIIELKGGVVLLRFGVHPQELPLVLPG